jgi:hypothetical protein
MDLNFSVSNEKSMKTEEFGFILINFLLQKKMLLLKVENLLLGNQVQK